MGATGVGDGARCSGGCVGKGDEGNARGCVRGIAGADGGGGRVGAAAWARAAAEIPRLVLEDTGAASQAGASSSSEDET